MKTPDESKKGLMETIEEACWVVEGSDAHNLQDVYGMAHESMDDSLAYIQQLEADNAQQARCIENLTDKLNAMNDEVAELQAENAQLLRDVHGKCGACKWMYADRFERVCDPCLSEIKDNFEWRGVQKEE